MSGETIPRSDAEVEAVNRSFYEIVANNPLPHKGRDAVDAEFAGIIEHNYGPYVAEPLFVDNVGVFFPYDWPPEALFLSQELFKDFTPAPIMGCPTFEEFQTAVRPDLNGEIGAFNFLSALAAKEDTIMDMALQQKPAYQRAKLLAPDLGIDIDSLREELRSYSGNTDIIPVELLRRSFEVLDLVVKLVDHKDDNVLKHIADTPDGAAYGIDALYLLH